MPPNLKSPESVIGDPVGFAKAVLGLDLYPKQRDVLAAMVHLGARVSFRSCNEGGKTKRVICTAILWHLANFPKGKIISTSGSYRQIKDQLLPALHVYANRFPRWSFLRTPRIETDSVNCFWEGFSTNDAGKFEGHHEEGRRDDPDEPLLIIVDEAKTVKDDIFQAIERCKPTRLLIASSPGYAEGEFYRSHTTKAKFYQTFRQTAEECPHISAEEIQQTREKWGADHPLVLSMIDAQFMAFVQNAVVDLKALEDLLADPPPARRGERKAFCDFAWGGDGDENVLALRDGNLVTLEETFRADNLHAITGRFISAYTRLGLKAWEIEGDEGGGGKLIIDQLHESGWPIGRVNNGSAPRRDEHYANAAAEMWFDGAMQIARRQVILPDDDDLKGQMLDRKKVANAKGKLAVESKKDMKKGNREGGPANSPDRADAVFGAMAPLMNMRAYQVMGQNEKHLQGNKDNWPMEEYTEAVGEIPGAHFG